MSIVLLLGVACIVFGAGVAAGSGLRRMSTADARITEQAALEKARESALEAEAILGQLETARKSLVVALVSRTNAQIKLGQAEARLAEFESANGAPVDPS